MVMDFELDRAMALFGIGFAFLAIVIASNCSGQAKSSEPVQMTCEEMLFGSSPGERCLSAEAICFIRNDQMSCIKKE